MGAMDFEGNTGNRKRREAAPAPANRWADEAGDAGGVGWDTCDWALFKRVAVLATRQKMAVSIAATADNRGVSVTLLDGADRPKWYANTTAELNKRLEWLIERLT